LPLLPGGARILELGAGDGWQANELARAGFQVTAVDVGPPSSDVQHFPVSRYDGRSLPFEAGSFDAVVSFEVIEHLLRPRSLFEGARAALEARGRLAVSTPYHGFVKSVAVAALRFDEHFAVEGDHIRFFSDRALEKLAGETGFEVERIHHLGRAWPVWANSLLWARRRA
jgi:2-polyprenyl-3-methyl-5-hydroxy-6-metoxy-1,4-benzoquinol methylase